MQRNEATILKNSQGKHRPDLSILEEKLFLIKVKQVAKTISNDETLQQKPVRVEVIEFQQ